MAIDEATLSAAIAATLPTSLELCRAEIASIHASSHSGTEVTLGAARIALLEGRIAEIESGREAARLGHDEAKHDASLEGRAEAGDRNAQRQVDEARHAAAKREAKA